MPPVSCKFPTRWLSVYFSATYFRDTFLINHHCENNFQHGLRGGQVQLLLLGLQQQGPPAQGTVPWYYSIIIVDFCYWQRAIFQNGVVNVNI